MVPTKHAGCQVQAGVASIAWNIWSSAFVLIMESVDWMFKHA